PPGSDGVAGVLTPEAAGLSTWLFGQDRSILGRARRAGGSKIHPAAPGSWLALGERAELLEIVEGPLPVERWRRRVGDPLLEKWGPLTATDYDHDGGRDVIAVHKARDPPESYWTGTAKVFLGDGEGSFVPAGEHQLGDVENVVCADFD